MADKVIEKIREQVGLTPDHMVYVLQVLSVRFDGFTTALMNELQRFQNLQMLTMNDCAIKSLAGFPHLPGLIRLDLVFNEIPGNNLNHIVGCRHLQTLMLGANKIQKVDDLVVLKGMKQLFQLDLINNPVQSQAGYRPKVFNLLPTLTVLDTLDKSGKDAYNTTSMVQTASRVPQSLFDTSKPSTFSFGGVAPAPVSMFGSGTTGLFAPSPAAIPVKAPAKRKGSLKVPSPIIPPVSVPAVAPARPSRTSKVSKASKGGKAALPKTSHTRSGRAGLVFPVTRIKRHLHGAMTQNRISVGSAVFMAAVLEYLTAEVVELAGTACKQEKKVRITPRMIKLAIDHDEELKKLLVDVTIPRQQ